MPSQSVFVAGIDEAGYGPLLGPLAVSATAFALPADMARKNLWSVLRASVTNRLRRGETRLLVADSKRLFTQAQGPGRLERAVLAFLRLAGRRPRDVHGLIRLLAGGRPALLDAHPWYQQARLPLPSCCDSNDVATQANALRADLGRQGASFVGVWAQTLLEGEFNELVGKTDSKSRLLLSLTTRLIDRVASSVGSGRRLRIWVDKQGARNSYAQPLMLAFPQARLRILAESPERSDYELRLPGRLVRVGFVARGESEHLPVALASMFSKYVREMLMACFNAYWTEHVPRLRPTGGYYQDGMRFLKDIGPTLEAMGVDRGRLARSR
jgi:ribonuclease HII